MSTEPVVVKKKRARWPWIVGPIVLLGLCAAFTMDWSGDAPTPGAPKPAAAGLTLANFNRVTTGMDCTELAGIFGSPGTLTAETGTGEFLTQAFDWQKTSLVDNAVVTVMCQGGKVDTKAQAGLK